MAKSRMDSGETFLLPMQLNCSSVLPSGKIASMSESDVCRCEVRINLLNPVHLDETNVRTHPDMTLTHHPEKKEKNRRGVQSLIARHRNAPLQIICDFYLNPNQ